MDSCSPPCSSATRCRRSTTLRTLIRRLQTLRRCESWSQVTRNHLTHAWSQITARPHPYLSHANDHVRSYLLSRVKSIDSDIEVVDDLNSTVVYSRPGAGVYFEGTNILVKIPGSGKHESNAVLFSAHYDSVSSAPGATDNGIGAVAALHFLEWVVKVQVTGMYLQHPQQVPGKHASQQTAS
jgi:hypothetical protein